MAYTTRLGGGDANFQGMMKNGFGIVTVMNAKVYDAMDCITSKYVQAGELMKTAGDIGGVPFDGGKTEKSGAELKKITTETEEVIGDLEKRIADLEAQIATLYAQYQAALAREAEEARAAAKRNVSVQMTK